MLSARFDSHALQPGQWVKFFSSSPNVSLDPQEREFYENGEIYFVFSRSKADQLTPDACCFLMDTKLKIHKLVLNGSFDGMSLNLETQIKMLGQNAESTNCSSVIKAAVARAAFRCLEHNKDYFDIHPSEVLQPLGKRERVSDLSSSTVENCAAAAAISSSSRDPEAPSPLKRARSVQDARLAIFPSDY